MNAVFCPASEKKESKGLLVTKNGGHVEYMWAIKIDKNKSYIYKINTSL